jgi:hypothetical protein
VPRIIVTTDPAHLIDDSPVLLDERVHSVHLSSNHAAAQLIERLIWAIGDAEDAESGRVEERLRPLPAPATASPHASSAVVAT